MQSRMSRKGNTSASRRGRARELNSRTIVDCLLTPLCLPGMDETMFVTTRDTRQASRLLLAHVLEVAEGVETGPLSDTPFRVDRDAVRVARAALDRFLDNSTEFINIMAVSKSGSNTPGAAFSSMFFRASPDVGVIKTLCDTHASRLAVERLRHMQTMIKTSIVGSEVFETLRVATHPAVTKTLKDLEFNASPFAVFTAPRVLAALFPKVTPSKTTGILDHLEQMYINLRLAEYVTIHGGGGDGGASESDSDSDSDRVPVYLKTLPSAPTSLMDLQQSPFFLAFGLLSGLSVGTLQSTQRLLAAIGDFVNADTVGDARLAVTKTEGGQVAVFMSPKTSTELDAATGNAWPNIIKSLSGLRSACIAWMEMVMECVRSVTATPPAEATTTTTDQADNIDLIIPGTNFKLAGTAAVEAAWTAFVCNVHGVMGERGFHRLIKAVQVVAREIGDLGDGLALFASRDMTQTTPVQYKSRDDTSTGVVVPPGDMVTMAMSAHMRSIISTFQADFRFVPLMYDDSGGGGIAGRKRRRRRGGRPATARLPPGCSRDNMSPALLAGREASLEGLPDPGSALRFANMAVVTLACLAPIRDAGPLIFRLGTTEAPGAFPMIPAVPGSGFVPSSTALGTVINVCTRVFHPAVPATVLAHHPVWNTTNPAIRRAVMELAYERLLGLARAGRLAEVLPSAKRLANMRPFEVTTAARCTRFDAHTLPMSRRGDADVLALSFMPQNAATVLASRKVTANTNTIPDYIQALASACHRLATINAARAKSIIGVASDTQIVGEHSRVHTMRRMLLAEADRVTIDHLSARAVVVAVGPGTGNGAGVSAGTSSDGDDGDDDDDDVLPSPFALLSASTHAMARRTMLKIHGVMAMRQARLPFYQPRDMMNDLAEIEDDVTATALLNLAMRVFHAVFYVIRRENRPAATSRGDDDDGAQDEFTEWCATTHVCNVVMAPFLASAFPADAIPGARKRLLASVMSRVRTHVSHVAAVTVDGRPVARKRSFLCEDEDEDEDGPVLPVGLSPPKKPTTRVVIVKHAWTGHGMVASHVPGTDTRPSPELTRAIRLGTTKEVATSNLTRINLPDASQVPGVGRWTVIDPGGDALTYVTARTPTTSIAGSVQAGGGAGAGAGAEDCDDKEEEEKPRKRQRRAPQEDEEEEMWHSVITDGDLNLLSKSACASTNPETLIAVETLHNFIRSHIMTPSNTNDRFHVCAVRPRPTHAEQLEVPIYGPCITTIGAPVSGLKLRSPAVEVPLSPLPTTPAAAAAAVAPAEGKKKKKKVIRRRIGAVIAAAAGLPTGTSVFGSHNNMCDMRTAGCINYLHHTQAAASKSKHTLF